MFYAYFFSFYFAILTAHYLGRRNSPEYLQYLQRAVANPIVIGRPSDPKKVYLAGNLADYYMRHRRLKEAQALFKHIIDSKLVPADVYRYHLADAYMHSDNYDEAGELFCDLYCKREFEAEPEYLSIFEMQSGKCLREAVCKGLAFLSDYYFNLSGECRNKGEALATGGDNAGECYYL